MATPIVGRKSRTTKQSPALMARALDGPEDRAFAALAGVAATLFTLAAEDIAEKDLDARRRGECFSFLAQSVRCADQILRRGRQG